MRTVATVGVYGFTAETFLARLRAADVGLLLDVRQRRGVRGPEYAWANSARLQAALAAAGIRERYVAEILDRADLDAIVAELPTDRAAALMCVERDPQACHRSLIAERLAAAYGVEVIHLRPDGRRYLIES